MPQTHRTTPAPPDAVSRVEAELRGAWWSTTLAMSVPAVLSVLLGYVVVVAVGNGDWLALLFPGIVVAGCAFVAVRILYGAIAVKQREARLPSAERDQAVYVRGLSGTHRLAAAQDATALAVVDPIWRPWEGRVVAVRTVRRSRTRRGPRNTVEVDVQQPGGPRVAALLTASPDATPSRGDHCRVLQDPHHDRAVIDLRPSNKRRRDTTTGRRTGN